MTKYYLIILLLLLVNRLNAQHVISGFIYDEDTHEKLIGATIIDANTVNGTLSNNDGYFTFSINSDSISVSFVGYQSKKIFIQNNAILEIYLKPGTQLSEVSIYHNRFKQTNISKLSSSEILKIPSLGGKPDVLKALQLTPGIQGQTEGSSLLNVRGGSPGENLYLIDDIPLIYVNHIGGFLSVFNPDMINSIDVYKSNFPAKYGGKLSSVLAISQREGNKKQWRGNLGIGITDVSFNIEGPIIEDTMSLIVTGRKTLIDYPMALMTYLINDDYMMYYGFHDVNAKWSYKPNKTNSFNANAYIGSDYINYRLIPLNLEEDNIKYFNKWGNYMLSGKWNRVINNKLFVANSVSTTRYRLMRKSKVNPGIKDTIDVLISDFRSIVQDVSIRSDWQMNPNNQLKLSFGAKTSLLHGVPSKTIYSVNSISRPNKTNGFEASIYENTIWKPIQNLELNAGFRFVNYFSSGYNINKLEPRLSANILLGNHQFSANYQKINQFTHLLLAAGAVFNNEVWITADHDIPAAQSQQYGISWLSNFINNTYSAEFNIYQKKSTNLATYKEGFSTLLGDGNWKNKVEINGIGESKGIELFIRKNKGELTGFVSYTYSNTTRQFPGINNGEQYTFDYDRPHSLSISINKQLNDNWDFNAAWIYQTGLPYTPVVGSYLTYIDEDEIETVIYGKRNSKRMKNYHRLDISFVYNKINKKGRKVEWNFSVYNIYNRKNANSYYYAYSPDPSDSYIAEGEDYLKQYQNSFFPFIPSISYKVYFNEIKHIGKLNLN